MSHRNIDRLNATFLDRYVRGHGMFTTKEMADWGSALLVFASGGMAGHYFALGMTPVQLAGAVTAVLGSVTVAVAVRIWPMPAKSKVEQAD